MSIEKSLIQTIVNGYKLATGREGKDPSRCHPAIAAAEQYLHTIETPCLEDHQIVKLVTCFIIYPTKDKHPSDNVFLKIIRVIREIKTNKQLSTEKSTLERLRNRLRNTRELDVHSFDEIIRSQVSSDLIRAKNSVESPAVVEPALVYFPQELSQKDLEIQQQQTQIVVLQQQLDQCFTLFSRAQAALQSKTIQVKELGEFLQAQDDSLAQQQEMIQQQKALLERLAEDCNKLATQGLDIMGHFMESIDEARSHFSQGISTPKKASSNKNPALDFSTDIDAQVAVNTSLVFDSVRASCLKIEPLIKEFTAVTESQALDILDTLVYPDSVPRILPENWKDNPAAEQEIAEILRIRLDQSALAGLVIPALPLAVGPPPPPPPAPPPPPPFDPEKLKSGRLSKQPHSLVNKLGASEQKKNSSEEKAKGLAITDQATLQAGLSKLKKTQGLNPLNEKKIFPAINPEHQALLDRVAANKAAREAREAKARQNASILSPHRKAQKEKIADLQDTLHDGLSKLTAANYGHDDSWSHEGNSFDI